MSTSRTIRPPRAPMFPAFLLPQGTIKTVNGRRWKVVQWGPYVGTTSWNMEGVWYINPDGTPMRWG